MPDKLRIRMLLENTAARPDVRSEHGLSMLVETPEKTILWDTGQSAMFLDNAAAMHVPLETVDAVALSHGHYDHTGGLEAFLARYPGVDVYAHPAVFLERYTPRSAADNPPWSIGLTLSQEDLSAKCRSLVLRDTPAEIAPGIHLSGEIPRVTAYEDTGGDFYLDRECSVPDPIPDDQALFIETPKGIVVLLGCAHSGVVNILDYCDAILDTPDIYALIGGMHLIRADEHRLEKTADVFELYRIQHLGPCHCTGDTAMGYFREHFPERMLDCGTGTVIEI